MINAVVDTTTKEIKYITSDLHNACTERDMLNANLPMLEQKYSVISTINGIKEYCGITNAELKRLRF